MKSAKKDSGTLPEKIERGDSFLDRRSGEDRRMVYSLEYFRLNKPCKRSEHERRTNFERRAGCVRVSEWSSVCPMTEDQEHNDGRIDLSR